MLPTFSDVNVTVTAKSIVILQINYVSGHHIIYHDMGHRKRIVWCGTTNKGHQDVSKTPTNRPRQGGQSC